MPHLMSISGRASFPCRWWVSRSVSIISIIRVGIAGKQRSRSDPPAGLSASGLFHFHSVKGWYTDRVNTLHQQLDQQLDRFLRKSPSLGQDVYLARSAVVLGDVTLGDHSSVWYNTVLRGDINRIVVGHHTNIQDNSVLHLADEFPCVVANWVTIGH